MFCSGLVQADLVICESRYQKYVFLITNLHMKRPKNDYKLEDRFYKRMSLNYINANSQKRPHTTRSACITFSKLMICISDYWKTPNLWNARVESWTSVRNSWQKRRPLEHPSSTILSIRKKFYSDRETEWVFPVATMLFCADRKFEHLLILQ